MEQSAKLNGFKPRSYGDIVAIASLLTMLVAVIAWGLKLEDELNQVRDRLVVVQGQVGQGILPRAEERILSLRRDVDDLTDELDEHVH